MIYEFKSEHPKAKEEGERQLVGYLKDVTNYYQSMLDKNEDPDADHGGKEIMKQFTENGCIKDKRIAFDKKVEPYAMCERRWMCVEP
jgi:hypothetical protein